MSVKNSPADAVEQRPIESLIPYAKNARTHSDEQVAQIAASIREWGFTVPVLIDESGGVIAGHGRLMAARKLGMTSLPVMVATGWTDDQKRAYVIADNKLAQNAGWDNDMLALELAGLGDAGFDLQLTGFDNGDIGKLVADHHPPDVGGIDYQEKYAVLVECTCEAEQEEIFNRLTGYGLKCKVLVN